MITQVPQTIEKTDAQPLKVAVRKFWGARPCGIGHSSQPADSRGFFLETEDHRFKIHTDWERPFLKEAAGFSEHTGKLVLEVGCGIGTDALEWSRAGNRVVALDYNFPSCQLTRARFKDAGAEGAFLNGDAENLPFPSDAFDLIYSFGVLHHTPGTERAVLEIYRCLRLGGQAIVMLYYKWSAMVFGTIILGYGIRHGALRKSKGFVDLVSRHTEWDSRTQDNVCPLTKVYSKRQAKKMFSSFRRVDMELHYLWAGHFGPLRRLLPLLPEAGKRNLHKLFGWNLLIKATK